MNLWKLLLKFIATRRIERDRRFVRESSRWPKVDRSLDSIERHKRETGAR